MEAFAITDLTDFQITWIDQWEAGKERYAEKIALGMFHIWNAIIATFLHVGFMDYEKYGGDPQKRSINNQVS